MLIKENLRNVLEQTNFSAAFKGNCTYYVYHTGKINYGKGFKPNQKIVTISEMEVIFNSAEQQVNDLRVPYAEFTSDMFNNYILYEQSSDNAMLCNIRGYDLAVLCNQYSSTSMGRNILFGQNLRDSLDAKKSKTYDEMMLTIDKEPERFWNYNNGITIICEMLDAHRPEKNSIVDTIEITKFSIINGAQTTHALGSYLKNALINDDFEAIERLKKVYVLVRIMQVNDKNLRNNISIYNNLQNPITTRDMVSNHIEQKKLRSTFMEGEAPNIYVETRRGETMPSHPRFEKHQQTTNEDLAQLAFAAFMKKPWYSKDKKKTLFNKDNSTTEYVVNEYYHQIFYYPENTDETPGVLFERSREEIDEALFIKYLYKLARTRQKKIFDENIARSNERLLSDARNAERYNKMIETSQRNKEINNTCLFYCVTLYFTLKDMYATPRTKNRFDYIAFYRGGRDCTYKDDIVKYFSEKFLLNTIKIITDLMGASGSVTNWLRRPKSQDEFLDKLSDEMMMGTSYEEMYMRFIDEFALR